METQPHIYIERAVLETEAYQMYEGKVSIPELRALTLKPCRPRRNTGPAYRTSRRRYRDISAG